MLNTSLLTASDSDGNGMESRVVVAGIFLLHILVVGALMRTVTVAPEREPQVLQATLIVPQPPRPEPTPPRPPVMQPKAAPLPRPSQPAPVIAAAVTAPSATSAPPAPPVVVPPTPAPAPVSAPRFDADYLDNPKPLYPSISRRMGEEGKVVLRVFVEPNGRPSKLEVQHSSGSTRLDSAASNAVSQWKFVPARQGNEAVGAWVLVPITFKLDS